VGLGVPLLLLVLLVLMLLCEVQPSVFLYYTLLHWLRLGLFLSKMGRTNFDVQLRLS
jgi:hypothetical protein